MKKALWLFLVCGFLFFVGTNVTAQQYFVYDGQSFSVMLTTDDYNTEVYAVSFSYKGSWVEFDIIDFENLESTSEGGFLYTVEDTKGSLFTIDYYRDYDYIIVINLETGDEWTLYRR